VINNFVEQLRLAEKAAEDIYFANVNRELIEALHKPTPGGEAFCCSLLKRAPMRGHSGNVFFCGAFQTSDRVR
jgi:hypothetical protein